MTDHSLAALRKKVEKSEEQADKDKAALLKVAVAEAITSDEYGHVTAVARKAGITSQYLRDLVEAEHPGWLAEASRRRKARKEEAESQKRNRSSSGAAA